MEIRLANKYDLGIILELGRQFSHQMAYQKDPESMLRCINRGRVIVAEAPEDNPTSYTLRETSKVVGYYHFIVSGDPGFLEMLRVYRQMPENIIRLAEGMLPGRLCVMMQGGCHRDAFQLLVGKIQSTYPEVWSWNSISNPNQPSSKIQGYKDLGFVFEPMMDSTFWNCNKGDFSTYMLGRWDKPVEREVHGN